MSDNVYVADLPADVTVELIEQIFGNYGTIVSSKAMQAKYDGHRGAALVRFSSVDEAQWVVENCNGCVPEGLSDPVQVRFANQKNNGWGSSSYGQGDREQSSYGKAEAVPPWHEDSGGSNGGWQRPTPWSGGKDSGGKAVVRYSSGKAKGDKGGDSWSSTSGKGKKGYTVSNSDIGEVLSKLKRSKALPGGRQPDEHCLYITGLPNNTTDTDLYRIFAPFGAIPAEGVFAKPHPDGSCTGIGFVDFLDPQCAQEAINVLNGMILPDGVTLGVSIKKPKN